MKTGSVWYNDSEPFVCDWLENLIREKLLPQGVVDRRPIQEVEPSDVRDFAQCHFFAGIGGWAYALQLAGWGDRPVWTGSCPCQPFSTAGKGQAEDDPRHLWPSWFRLIRECRPERIFGEQVANAAGKGWLDVVATDLETEAYAVGAVVLGAHSVGAPHLRQRIWWVADTEGTRDDAETPRRKWKDAPQPGFCGSAVAYSDCERKLQPQGREPDQWGRARHGSAVSDAPISRLSDRSAVAVAEPETEPQPERPSWWATEPAVGRLAHGIPGRVGQLRAYGNSIVPAVAAAFIEAYLACSLPAPEDRPQ